MATQTFRQPTSPHVRFTSLPKPNHRTGSVIHFLAPSHPFNLRDPANGVISQRRVQVRDEEGDKFVEEAFEAWQEDNPEGQTPAWKEVRWTVEQHPGCRLAVLIDDGEVSPKSFQWVPVPAEPRITMDNVGAPGVRAEPRITTHNVEPLGLQFEGGELLECSPACSSPRPRSKRSRVKRILRRVMRWSLSVVQ